MFSKIPITLLVVFVILFSVLGQNLDNQVEIKKGSYVPGKLIVTFRVDSINLNAGDSQFLTIRNIISQETRTEMEKLGIDT